MSCKYCYQTDHTIENCKTIICKVCRESGHPHWLCKKSKKGGNHKRGTSQKNQNETITRNFSQSSISTQPVIQETSSIPSIPPPPPPVIIESNIGNTNKKTMASVLASSLQSKNKSSSIVATPVSTTVSQNVSTVVVNTLETEPEQEVCVESNVSETIVMSPPPPPVSKTTNTNISHMFHNIETRSTRYNDTKRDLQFYLKQSKKRWSEIL